MQIKDIASKCAQNTYFRQVLATGPHSQVVIMNIKPGEDIGEETHPANDQILYLLSGSGQAVLDHQASDFAAGDLVLVPAGTLHNFINSGQADLKIITTYSPPNHPDGTVHKTKAEAAAAEAATT
ncbi:MAG TPA: cupin domain-containing protein, partial [Candidatus Saccharimonadales bacterium]|nr:cupin domain-containing protein [Candidatus Saccharimonadales bacterium]